MATWNGRAILHHKPKLRTSKKHLVDDLSLTCSVLAFQELHGTKEKFELAFARLHQKFFVFTSFTDRLDTQGLPKQDETGVALAFQKFGASSSNCFSQKSFAAGRVLRVAACCGLQESMYWCVHNHGLSAGQLVEIAHVLESDVCRARENPQRVTVCVLGDFNYLCSGEYQRSLEHPNDSRSGSHSLPAPRACQARWEHILRDLTEMSQPLDTHFSLANCLCSRIDRIYTSIPPWLLIQISIASYVYKDPKTMYDMHLSDHSPLKVTFSTRAPMPWEQRPVSRHVVADPRYAQYLQKLVLVSNLDSLAVPLRLQHFKVLMRESARLVRDERSIHSTTDPVAQSSLFGTMARAVWNNDTKVASILIAKHGAAREHLQILDGTVTVKDPPNFQHAFCHARLLAAECKKAWKDRSISEPDAPSAIRRRANARGAAQDRLKKLWSPFHKKLRIAGIRIGNGTVRSTSGMIEAQARHWGPVFNEQPFDEIDADRFLSNYSPRFDFTGIPPPSSSSFRVFLSHARHSAPGVDGLPYAAWRYTGDDACNLLFEASLWLCTGRSLCIDFNDVLHYFAAKGDEDLDHVEILRTPGESRPLGLKNTDNKSIGACTNHSMKRAIGSGANRLQNGFIYQRNFLDNIVQLDTAARVYSMSSSSLLPIVALFDYGAAFPSVIHRWLFLILRRIGLPLGAINIGVLMYSMVMGFGRGDQGITVFLFMILSGVLQGCPLSGSFFVLCLDPFLQAFDCVIVQPQLGVTGACADDIGASLSSINLLSTMFPIFETAHALAGLCLKVAKCVIVPLSGNFSDALRDLVAKWLLEHLPAWADFQVVEAGKYLGAYVGPAAGKKLWTNPSNKWATRAHAIGSASMPLSLSASLYNTRALPTLGYIAQFSLLPEHVLRQERFILAKI